MKKKIYIICISTLLIFSLMGCSGQKMEMHNGQGKGIVTGGGINDPSEAVKHTDATTKAYNLGKGL